MEEKTIRGLREVALLGFSAIALFFIIALVTFSNEDPGWSHSGTRDSIANACGMAGAWIADFTLSIFGLMAFLFPVMILWHGYLVYRQGKKSASKWVIGLRWLGFAATVISGCALLYLHLMRVWIDLPGTAGGILGQETGDALLVVLGNSGATLLLLAVFLAGVTLFTGLSWLTVMDMVGKYTLLFCRYLYESVLAMQAHRTEKRMSMPPVVAKPAKQKKKTKVKIAPTLSKVESSDREAREQQVDIFDAYEGALPSLPLLDENHTHVQSYSKAELGNEGVLGPLGNAHEAAAYHWYGLDKPLYLALEFLGEAPSNLTAEKRREGTHVLRDAHLVIV